MNFISGKICQMLKYTGHLIIDKPNKKYLKTLAIIPARKNSKRLKGKNIKELCGISLFMHSVSYARNNPKIIDDIIITTDDPVIMDIAQQEKVRCIHRPEDLATDTSSTVEAMQHVLQNIEDKYDCIILLQPTNPLRPENLLRDCWRKFLEYKSESLFCVSRNHQKLGRIENDKFHPMNYEFGQRSQDIEPLYYENGLLYIAKSEMLEKGKLMDKKSYPFFIDHPFADVDIDEKKDFEYAEYLFKKYISLK